MDKPGITPLTEFGKKNLRIENSFIREAIGEFIGTLIVGFMCVGAGGQFMIKTKDGIESQIVPVLGIILGIMTAILITGGVSGGHVNPAVSIALAVVGELSWYSVPGYVVSQFLGAIIGSLLGWGLIHPSIRQSFGVPSDMTIPEFDMKYNSTHIASLFSPLRSPGCTLFNGLATELVLTCFLIMAICGVVDKQSSMKPPAYLIPIVIPLVIAAFCFAHDLPTGTLLNPARDLGPKIAACILGWKPKFVFMSKDWKGNTQHWWVVGLFGPILGGILGALIYALVIGPQVNLDHLQVSNVPLQQQQRVAIREMISGANTGDNSSDWRSSNTTSSFIYKHRHAKNINPFPAFTTHNGAINEEFQHQGTYPSSQLQYPNSRYPNTSNIINNSSNCGGGGLSLGRA